MAPEHQSDPGECEREPAAEPRAVVMSFAQAMEAELCAHDASKGDWRTENLYRLLNAARAELRELDEAVMEYRAARATHSTFGSDDHWTHVAGSMFLLSEAHAAVRSEAADLALYAMMIADACDALPGTAPRDARGRALLTRSNPAHGANHPARCVDCGGVRVVGDGWPCPTCCGGDADADADADAGCDTGDRDAEGAG